jgi:hypothetical protein
MYKNESGNINIDTAVGTASTLGFIGFQGMSATGYLRGATIQAVTENTNVATGLRFLTKGTTGTAATRMTINSDGNVGIGTLIATNKLMIQNGNYSMSDTGYALGLTTNNFGIILEISGNIGGNAALWIKNDTPSAPVSTMLRVNNNGYIDYGGPADSGIVNFGWIARIGSLVDCQDVWHAGGEILHWIPPKNNRF